MTDYTIRLWQPEDKPRMKALWEDAFGDDGEFIDTFYRCFLKKDTCLVAECDGKVVSAMYILDDFRVYPYRKNVLKAGYAYALATDPEYQGRGIGKAVYKAVTEKILETHDIAFVLPAEESLYPFYEQAAGAKPMTIMREARFTPEDLRDVERVPAARIPAFQYAGMREMFMNGLPHAACTEPFIDFMEEYVEADHGDFFLTEHGIAAVETVGDTCRISELLCPDTDGMAAIAGVAAYYRDAEEYIVRSPFFFDGPGKKKTVMLGVMKEEPDYPMPFDMWFGLGLD